MGAADSLDMDQNPYEVLQLDKEHESSEADIKKAYRKLALTKHPDKQRNNPDAAAEFMLIQKAYDVLTDAAARAAWDELARAKAARAARQAGASAKRRKMMADLDARERVWKAERSEEDAARAKLKAELERLRRRHAERARAARAERAVAAVAASFSGGRCDAEGGGPGAAAAPSVVPEAPAAVPPQITDPQITEELMRTLKVTWDVSEGGYTAEQLRAAFAAHGGVADVVLRESKRRSKGSALVVMPSLAAAAAAAACANGRPGAPLLVVPFSKVAVVGEPAPSGQLPPAQRAPSALHLPAQPAAPPLTAARHAGARFAAFPSTYPTQPPPQTLAPQPSGPGQAGSSAFHSFPTAFPAGGSASASPSAAPPGTGSGRLASFPGAVHVERLVPGGGAPDAQAAAPCADGGRFPSFPGAVPVVGAVPAGVGGGAAVRQNSGCAGGGGLALFPAGRHGGARLGVSGSGNGFASFPVGGPARVGGAAPAPAAMPPSMGSASRDFESVTLMKLRQRAERERLIAELQALGDAE